MNIDKQSLDRYLTTEPNNGYHDWVEEIFDKIPESEISGDDYNKYESIFDDMLNEASLQGANGGFITTDFMATVLIRRCKVLKANPQIKT